VKLGFCFSRYWEFQKTTKSFFTSRIEGLPLLLILQSDYSTKTVKNTIADAVNIIFIVLRGPRDEIPLGYLLALIGRLFLT
jgi:hypothetical protein